MGDLANSVGSSIGSLVPNAINAAADAVSALGAQVQSLTGGDLRVPILGAIAVAILLAWLVLRR